MNPSEIPDSAVAYVPGYGETTVGALRSPVLALADDEEISVRMWGYIATHPWATPWKTGLIYVDGKEFPVCEYFSGRPRLHSTSNGTSGASESSDPSSITPDTP